MPTHSDDFPPCPGDGLAAWDGNAIDPILTDPALRGLSSSGTVWSRIPVRDVRLSRRRTFRDPREENYSPDPCVGDETLTDGPVCGLAALPEGGSLSVEGDCTLRFDFGLVFTGSVVIEMECPEGTAVSFATGEASEPLRCYPLEAEGPGVFRPRIEARGFTALRFAWLRFERIARPVRIRAVSGRMKHCPLPYAGSFACSDPLLERIWNVCAYSARLCVDCDFEKDGERGTWLSAVPFRRMEAKRRAGDALDSAVFTALAFDRVDRFPWAGDSRFIQLAVLHAFGAYEKCREALDYFWPRDSRDWAEFEYGCVPYLLDWGLAVLKYVEYSGDLAELRARLPQLEQIVERCRDRIPPGWLFFDWDWRITTSACNFGSPEAAVNEPEANAAFALKRIEFVREAGRILALAGETEAAVRFGGTARELAAAWQSEQPDWPSRFDLHALTNALLAGLGNEGERAAVFHRVYADPVARCTGTPYFGYSVLRALAALDRREDALEMLRRYWGGMLALGATTVWEEYEPEWTLRPLAMPPQPFGWGGLSLCQPAGSGPVEWLHREILGVRPLTVGFREVAVQPRPTGLEWARGVVPTPHGPLQVEWERTGGKWRLDCRAPAGVRVVEAQLDATPGCGKSAP